jgi:hypothetical protein
MKPKIEHSLPISQEDLEIERRSAEAEKYVARLEARAEKGILGESKHPTKFIIEKETVSVKRSDTDVKFATQHFTVARSNPHAPFTYFKIKDLSNTSEVEVLMRTDAGLENVGLPGVMLERLVEYIRTESFGALGDFDCGSFAHFMAGVPYTSGIFNPEDWDISLLVDESEQKAGDIIMIGGDEDYTVQNTDVQKTITHLAVYLGSGLYLSKFGASGKLIVANIEEMKKGFGGTTVYRLSVPQI